MTGNNLLANLSGGSFVLHQESIREFVLHDANIVVPGN